MPNNKAEPANEPMAIRAGEIFFRTTSSLSAGFPGSTSGVRCTERQTLTTAPHLPQVRSSSWISALQAGQVAESETGMDFNAESEWGS